jgi:signal transduction histidine kinase
MKLRHQGLIFLGIPLVCELLFLGALVFNLERLDEAAQREANAKRIIANCQEIRFSLNRYYMLLGAQRFMDTSRMEEKLASFSQNIDDKLALLRAASAGDKESSQIVKEYSANLGRAERLFADAAGSYERGSQRAVLARFVEESEFVEELFDCFQKTAHCEEQLIRRYEPVVREFQPQSLQNRQRLRDELVAIGALNTIVVVALFLYYRRHTLQRLRALMTNMSLFSLGRQDLVPVGGDDELAELDGKFRQMAEARDESESMRRSMYAMVSHDLRSPLTSTSLTLSFLLDSDTTQLPDNLSRKLQTINSEVNRLFRLSSSFLDMEKLEEGQFQLELTEIDATSLLKQALDAIAGQSNAKKVLIETRIEPPELLLKCDVDRTIQVLVNLLSNAVKYTPAQSTITVAVKTVCHEGSLPMIRFSITDQGKGISADNMDRLFTKYSQLEGSMAGGSGLGLFICKQLVEAHGGRVGADNVGDSGSCFWFELPT